MEAIPRITRAQSMDALSSQSNVAGYKAVLLGAEHSTRFFPMLMTAAGTIPPAKVLVLGVGVAGLQALATARRLGAQTTGYDVRPEMAEQVESLGATVAGPRHRGRRRGRLRPRADRRGEARQQQQALTDATKGFDVVITTALVPGRPAPRLVTAEAVEGMKPGSVIVDLAGETGGNCELTEPGETVVKHDVTIVSPLNLPADDARARPPLYARNVQALLELLAGEDGALTLDFEDEIIAGACVTRDGEIVHEGAKKTVEGRSRRRRPRSPTAAPAEAAHDAGRHEPGDPRAGRLRRLRGDLEGPEHAAHAADVGHQRDPRDRRARRPPAARRSATPTASSTSFLLVIAIVFGTINVVGGFLVTDRMLEMFKAQAQGRSRRTTRR